MSLHRQLFAERQSVGAYDADRQVDCIRRWDDRRAQLEREITVGTSGADDNLQSIFDRQVLPILESLASPGERPVTVFLGGQPGAGKTQAQRTVLLRTLGRGCCRSSATTTGSSTPTMAGSWPTTRCTCPS
ncbi:zeta toxin family protein [Bifidobacterium cuniculi]|uniref:zeta toxin family protein n=1 Tax=Bifidobacterium cuniculi TaxID=1688 RepID=UPI00068A96C4|nr:zeta toxin family protein [Bifidobacterium cuniculi]